MSNLRSDLIPEIEAFVAEAAKHHEFFYMENHIGFGCVRVLYSDLDGTNIRNVFASDWSEMLTKLRERFCCRDHRQTPLPTDVSPHDPCALLNPDDYVIGGGAIGRHSCRRSTTTCQEKP